MPQPAQQKISGWSPNPTWVRDHRPECVSAIGLIVLAWTRVENQLASLVSAAVGGARAGVGGNIDSVVARIMGEVENNRTRVSMANAALAPLLEGTPLLQEWKELSGRLEKRAKDRNLVAHTEWAWSEDAPDYVLQIKKDRSKHLWNERDFIDSYERIKEIENELARFLTKVFAAIDSGTVRLRST